MKTLFSRLLLSFVLIIALIIVSVLASFYLFYTRSYDVQIIGENSRQAQYVARSLYSYINTAYKTMEELSFNSDVISLDTQRQTPVFVSAIQRNDYFELLYAQGMNGMQTGRSSGNLGNRKERWWFVKMEQIQTPFVSESYYSVGTNMPCASIFYPITLDSNAQDAQMIGIMEGDIKLSALHNVAVIKFKIHALTNTGHELTVNMKKTSAAVDNISQNGAYGRSAGNTGDFQRLRGAFGNQLGDEQYRRADQFSLNERRHAKKSTSMLIF